MQRTDALDFSDDLPQYVAECDEHLTAARHVLLALEADPGRADRTHFDALFRAFHSVKGLSAMVGVREAERLAHLVESYLGAVRSSRVALAAAGVEAMFAAVGALEGIVGAPDGGPPPQPADELVARFAALTPSDDGASCGPAPPAAGPEPEPAASVLTPDKRARLGEALRHGAHLWRVTFQPSAARAANGLTVDAVRARLQAAGDIIDATPTVVPGGGIVFTFIVASPGPTPPCPAAAEGLDVEPFQPAPAPEPAGPTVARPGATSLVRVDLGRLDDLMRSVGELVITRARLANDLDRIGPALSPRERRALEETSLALERQLRELRDGVMRVRLVPVRDVFDRMRFVVRDLARGVGRDVDLHLAGEQTEVDKFVVDRLADPLMHLVRNAVSHGIEPPADRAAAGKPGRGRIDLRAAAAGGAIRIEVEDDGRGVDPDAVFARARAAGLVAPADPVDPAVVLDLICTPGFSTREAADRASGRGVGMDVVRRAVEELGGTLTLHTRPGRGTRFVARLPLTLAIADALILRANGQTYAVAQSAVREVVQVEPGSIVALENNELLRHPGGVLPLVRLSELFGGSRPAGPFPALVAGDGAGAFALAADRVLGLREVVVRPLADPLVQVPGLAGATELGDGRAVLILDPVGLARSARASRRLTA